MRSLQLWAQPWWVNLLVLIPPATYFGFRKEPLLSGRRLIILAIFASAFGCVEATVVVYLRSAVGLLPGYKGSLSELHRSSIDYVQANSLSQFPQSLLTIETYREAATIVMLLAVALLSGSKSRSRWAAFLWMFALWDIAYYAALWTTVRWPTSLADADVLFLIPVPWIAPVWFPLLVSASTAFAVALSSLRKPNPFR